MCSRMLVTCSQLALSLCIVGAASLLFIQLYSLEKVSVVVLVDKIGDVYRCG